MKPVYQTKFNFGHGNCFQAAIASLLELELNDIPDFSEYKSQFWPKFWKWLNENGLSVVNLHTRPNGYHLITVHSPRFEDVNHALVGFNGDPVHDPYPGGNCEHKGIVNYTIIYPSDLGKWQIRK